ncbi:MAG: N-acetylglucosamine-6-phosphate deacetylase [Defluviitaleaceae bacterium]|nr:N-acetylglucosamine-6-phosphate deacetylase [Defluviitaleaceae bacterium]
MIITNGILFCPDGEFHQNDIEIQAETITNIGSNSSEKQQDTIIDAKDCYVVPGFVDIHIHGAAGSDFGDGTPQAIDNMAQFLVKHGVTGFLGTSLTLPEDKLTEIYKNARGFVGKSITNSISSQAVLQGIYMEGPFFSIEKRGAQNKDFIIGADYDMFLRLFEVSGNSVKIVAIAPEVENGMDFIKKVHSSCRVSLAHSCADYNTAQLAFENGASQTTHLFNGMNTFAHRDPGIVGAAADSEAYVEVICDGYHIHPSMVRSIFKLFGDDKVCLISDAISACGMPEGQYDLGGQAVTVKDGTATINNGSLAGSITVLTDCFRRAVDFGIPLESALKAATINPAKSIGLEDQIGSLAKGKHADMIIMNKDLSIKHVISSGNLVKH